MDYVLIMTEYFNLKIPKEKIRTLISTLEANGIKPRTKAEAVNTVLDNFLLNKILKKEEKD